MNTRNLKTPMEIKVKFIQILTMNKIVFFDDLPVDIQKYSDEKYFPCPSYPANRITDTKYFKDGYNGFVAKNSTQPRDPYIDKDRNMNGQKVYL